MRPSNLGISALVIAIAAITAGCNNSNDWRAYGFDSTHFSKQPTETSLNASTAATLHKNFDFAIPAGDVTAPGSATFTASPSVYNNIVYVGGLNGVFYAITATGASKGTVLWRYPPATAATPDACGITTAKLLIASGSGNPSGPGIASSAAVVDGVAGHTAVIFGAPDPSSNGGDGRLFAIDATSGQCIWKSAVIAPTSGTSKIGYSSPAIAHGRAFIGVSAKQPDAPITIGRIFSVMLTNGSFDPAFNFAASNAAAGGGVWSSPGITPSGNVVVTTGNSCNNSDPDCSASLPTQDFSMSMMKLDWTNGNVLWQVQPVDIHYDHDPDWAASAVVGQVSCGSLAVSVQKDGYVHAADIKTGGPFSNPACSYPGHSLECPRWSFPTVASLPFQADGHGDTRFIRPPALDGDHLFINSGGLNLTEIAPTNPNGDNPGRIVLNRLYSLNVCAADADRIRWIKDLDGIAGAPSVANGVIYIGTDAGSLYALADTDVLPPPSFVCSYPNVATGIACSSGGFKNVGVPQVVMKISLTGSITGIPAISNGQVFVATTSGHLYGLVQ